MIAAVCKPIPEDAPGDRVDVDGEIWFRCADGWTSSVGEPSAAQRKASGGVPYEQVEKYFGPLRVRGK